MALTPAVERQLDRLRGPDVAAIRGVILGLADEPKPPGARKLAGSDDLWRIRVRVDQQPWRVVYQLLPNERLIIITQVVRRDEATYRGL